MDKKGIRFMTVNLVTIERGINLNCWMSTVNSFMSASGEHPHKSTFTTDKNVWIIHSSHELTLKVCRAVAEYGESILEAQQTKNDKRKLSNR